MSVHFTLLAINKINGRKRVLLQEANIFLLENEELVLEVTEAQCPIYFQVEGGRINVAASRHYEMHAHLGSWEGNFFESSWESSNKDTSAAVLKVEEGREVFVIMSTREMIIHTLCFTVFRA